MENTETALIIVDVQVNMFSPENPVYQGEQLLATIARLREKARSAQIPIIYIQHGSQRQGHPMEVGSAGWQIHPALAPEPQDAIIQKHMSSSFYQTSLDEYLASHQIQKLVIAGIQTELCVDTICREACNRDYDVTLVKDGHSTWQRGELTVPQIIAHHNSLLNDWFVTVKEEQAISF
ncbi:cysteine hydrolase family protein [Ktedonobacter robiniae]|uniref:Isochorismatase n=1 Tax=Ktedonobacter robiniae TaxID=2778365 RepID=A0ABQ3UV43_9CHLR|nr:cysteine hydrolase family protein [Ktedonobacter robiniae]GHO56551.1 isochorismatase [Ktedonobacter robiniae]